MNIQRSAGKFKLQVSDDGMWIALPDGKKGFLFPVSKRSATCLLNCLMAIYKPNCPEVSCDLQNDEGHLNVCMQLNPEAKFVNIEFQYCEVANDRKAMEIFPSVSFRISEAENLRENLERYWRIFLRPSIGDVYYELIQDGWPDSILWDFPKEAVRALLPESYRDPDRWVWSDDYAVIAAHDGGSTWYAICYRDGRFAWLTKTFD